jgi:hypothetical protein
MKKAISILFLAFSTLLANSQSVEDALKGTFAQFNAAADFNSRLASSNRFVLIANKWSSDWIAHYYAAYAKAIMGAMEKENTKKVIYFDEAEKHLETAKSHLTTENDEIYVLTAMLANMRIGVFPDQWQKYLEMFSTNIKKAKELRKENPRIYHLEGMGKFYTPEAYGGGKKSALPYFQKAAEYFNMESDTDIRKPFWGKMLNEDMVKACSE